MRVTGIKTFKKAAVAFTTIKTVETSDQSQPLYDSGDIDTSETLVGEGTKTNSFTITLSDPIQAETLRTGAAEDITFDGIDATGASAVTVTLVNAKIFGRSGSNGHSKVAGTTLTGRCDSITYAPSA